MRGRITKAGFIILLLMLLCNGCAGQTSETVKPTDTENGTILSPTIRTTQAPSAVPSPTPTLSPTPTPTSTPTPTPIPGYKITSEKSKKLSGQYIQRNNELPCSYTIYSLGEKCVLISENTIENESGHEEVSLCLTLYNYNTNEIEQVKEIKCDYSEGYYYTELSTGKHFLLYSYEEKTYRIYDDNLECVSEIKNEAYPYRVGIVSEKLTEVYLIQNGKIYCIRQDGSTQLIYENAEWEESYITNLYCHDRYAHINYYTDVTEGFYAHTAFLDLYTGKAIWDMPGSYEIQLSPDGKYCVLKETYPNSKLTVYQTADCTMLCEIAIENWQEIHNGCVDWENGYLITYIHCNDRNLKAICEVRFYDLYTGEHCMSSILDCEEEYFYLKNGMFEPGIFYIYYQIENEGTRFSLWDCAEVEKTDISVYFPRYWEKNQDLPESLNTHRDELEEKFGIQILMGSEFEYDDSFYNCGNIMDGEIINRALETIEQVCMLYPEGFFLQLQNGDMKKFSIYLAGAITGKSDNTLDIAAGFASEHGYERAIVLDISMYGLYNNLIHEIGHHIQNEIHEKELLNSFQFENGFQEKNPKGFEYRYTYEDYFTVGTEYDKYVAWYDNEENAYFIDLYSLTYLTEDVARCFEYMIGEYGEQYYRCPHIRDKMQYLSDSLRRYFNTDGWPEKTTWEKKLENN